MLIYSNKHAHHTALRNGNIMPKQPLQNTQVNTNGRTLLYYKLANRLPLFTQSNLDIIILVQNRGE